MLNLTTTVSALALTFCVGAFVNMDNRTAPQTTEKVATVNGGVVIDDFTQEIYSWWDSSAEKWKREREEEVLKVTATGVGANYECFGKQFDEIDMTKNSVLKLKMRYTGATAPKIRINMKDSNGMVNNAQNVVKTLTGGDKMVDYYFDYTNKWKQSWPDAQTVDPVEIVEMLIFVNPGGPAWSGTLYLDDVSVVPLSECPKQ